MSNPVRILLVEDEFITRDDMRDALLGMGYEVSGEAMRAEQAIPILERGKTDLVILDIHLKGELTGIWLGEQITAKYGIPFIYLSAFSDRGTVASAADTQPAGYLVKPYTTSGLYAAIETAVRKHGGVNSGTGDEDAPPLGMEDNLFVKDDHIYRRIRVSDIYLVQSFRNYLEITTAEGRYVVRSTLADFAAQLPPAHFFATHRSYLVNLGRVTEIGNKFVKAGAFEVPLSRGVRETLMERVRLLG
ncbi:MAG: LytTR family transcriptional regulator DNA-binding domain-containing protein [Saprospiraceae bacterium]